MTTKLDRENRVALAVQFARLCPHIKASEISGDIETLGRLGARLVRHEERMCSCADYYNAHTAEDGSNPIGERIEARAAKIAAKYGAKINAQGDPRGYCLYIVRDGLRGNTWGGDEHGFGVN